MAGVMFRYKRKVKPSKKILVFAAGWLGDNIMLGSLILELKKQGVKNITILNPHKHFTGLFERIAGVDDVIYTSFPKKKLALLARILCSIDLKKHKFDEIIYAPNTIKSAIIGFLANIKVRTGWRGEKRYILINNLHQNKKKCAHMVQTYVQLAHDKMSDAIPLQDCPQPRLKYQKTNLIEAATKLDLYRPNPNKKNIMLCPGAAGGATKMWPLKYFITLAKYLLEKNYNVHILGGPAEQQIGLEIEQSLNHICTNWTGRTSLPEVIDIMQHADCVVANDSGLMHMAAAIKVPVIAIYGATIPGFAPPLSDKAISVWKPIGCRPCHSKTCKLKHLECLNKILPQEILSAVIEIT